MADIPEKDSERPKKEIPEITPIRKTEGFKGLRPKHVIIDEILRMPDEDAKINQFRKDFYSHELPTGYEPPFPTGRAEERMAELNVRPLDFSNHARQWQEGIRRGMAAEIEKPDKGEPFFPVDETDLVPDLDPHDIYEKLNRDLGPEPPGGDVA